MTPSPYSNAAPNSPMDTSAQLCRARPEVTSDISARMPPSPWLSARITKKQYFSDTISSSDQMISDSNPSAAAASTFPPASPSTVCMV